MAAKNMRFGLKLSVAYDFGDSLNDYRINRFIVGVCQVRRVLQPSVTIFLDGRQTKLFSIKVYT